MKILLGIPCLEMTHTRFMLNLMGLKRTADTKISITVASLIYDSRNSMAQKAIEGGYDRLMFLDSDMQFNPDLLERLSADMDSGLDYVSALCFMRMLPTKPCIYKNVTYGKNDYGIYHTSDPILDYPKDQLFDVEASGFGAVIMNVSLIEEVAKNYGMPFSPMMGFGEDISFCWKAKQLGAKLYCDSRIKVGHLGTYCYGEEDFEGGI